MEYEDLFNNRVAEDDGFLSEPSFIPVQKEKEAICETHWEQAENDYFCGWA